MEQAGVRQGMTTLLSRRGYGTLFFLLFFFYLVVMKRGGERYVYKSVFRIGDNGTVFSDHVILRRADESTFFNEIYKS